MSKGFVQEASSVSDRRGVSSNHGPGMSTGMPVEHHECHTRVSLHSFISTITICINYLGICWSFSQALICICVSNKKPFSADICKGTVQFEGTRNKPAVCHMRKWA